MNALEHKFKRWKQKREAGKVRYIFNWTIFSGFIALLAAYSIPALSKHDVSALVSLSQAAGIGLGGGFVFGALSWFINETWYQNELKKREEDENN